MAECSELIVSEDASDFIIKYNLSVYNEIKNMSDACIQCLDETWCIAHMLNTDDNKAFIAEKGYYAIPKLYGLMQTDTTNFDSSGITSILNQTYLNIRGQGVIVGFIDTGIDYTLDIFQFARNRSKILAIWDQTIPDRDNIELPEEYVNPGELPLLKQRGYDYGVVYERNVINEALEEKSRGGDPYSIVPSKDENGHGTFLAGIAAGAATSEYSGAAPDSEIVMVKLKPAKQYLREYFLINKNADAYEESDIMSGIRFLNYYAAKENKPLVICIGLGSGSGPRTGMTPLSDMLSVTAGKNNIVVVTAMGNEANARAHVEGISISDKEASDIDISVGEGIGGFSMEIWAETLDVLSISIVSPSGETIPRIPARVGASSVFKFLLEQTSVSVDYKVAETVSGKEVVFIRFETPAQGIWGIKVYSLTNIIGKYNAWLPIKQFMMGELFFLQSNPETTLTEPAAAFRVISVGSYNHITGGISIDSGRGYTANDRVKPDITAPGENVYGPQPGGLYTVKSGTSIAAAHVAGAAALLLTWGVYYGNVPTMSTSEVKTILIRGATRVQNMDYPNSVWGYGKLNLFEAFLQLRIK